MGIRLTKKKMRQGLAVHLEGGEELKYWGYAVIAADFALWKNRFFYVGLTDRRLMLLRVSAFGKLKEFLEIRLTDIAEMAHSPLGSLIAQVLVIIAGDGGKYTLQFQPIIGLENPQVAKEMYDYLLAEIKAGRLDIAVAGEG